MEVVRGYTAKAMSGIENFNWQRGVTPLSEPIPVVVLSVLYVFTVYGLQYLMSSRPKALALGNLPPLHNLILLVGSAAMFAGGLHTSIQEWNEHGRGLSWFVCIPPGTKPVGAYFFWSYVYYLR